MRTHGKSSTYRDDGCRCDPCRIAHTQACREERERRFERLANNPKLLVPHGSYSTYRNWGCRCVYCVAAHKVEKRRQRARTSA